MPIFLFLCKACDREVKKLLLPSNSKNPQTCSRCGSMMSRILGTPSARGVITADEYRGTKCDENIKEKLRERSDVHFVEHELPRIIEKHGHEFAVRHGFIDIEGNPTKKI